MVVCGSHVRNSLLLGCHLSKKSRGGISESLLCRNPESLVCPRGKKDITLAHIPGPCRHTDPSPCRHTPWRCDIPLNSDLLHRHGVVLVLQQSVAPPRRLHQRKHPRLRCGRARPRRPPTWQRRRGTGRADSDARPASSPPRRTSLRAACPPIPRRASAARRWLASSR